MFEWKFFFNIKTSTGSCFGSRCLKWTMHLSSLLYFLFINQGNLLEPACKLELINPTTVVKTQSGSRRFLPGRMENSAGLRRTRTGFWRLVKPDNCHKHPHTSTQFIWIWLHLIVFVFVNFLYDRIMQNYMNWLFHFSIPGWHGVNFSVTVVDLCFYTMFITTTVTINSLSLYGSL